MQSTDRVSQTLGLEAAGCATDVSTSMNNVIQAVELIRTIPGALIDCGVGQGADKFVAQLAKNQASVSHRPEFEWFVSETQRCFNEVHEWISPHRLPADHTFFLEYYGGLAIRTENCRFEAYGFGPMVLEWYSYLGPEDGFYGEGLLWVGYLGWASAEKYHDVDFYMDLAGTVQQYCVIEKPRRMLKEFPLTRTNKMPKVDYSPRGKIANSFAEWLKQAASTRGAFGRF